MGTGSSIYVLCDPVEAHPLLCSPCPTQYSEILGLTIRGGTKAQANRAGGLFLFARRVSSIGLDSMLYFLFSFGLFETG